jgi:hypothetical protein
MFQNKLNPKEIKKENVFSGYSSHGSQPLGLVTAGSRDHLFEMENMGMALCQIVLAIYKFQPSPNFSLSPKLLPGTNTKRIALHRLFKEINYKPLLFYKPNKFNY